MTTFGFVLSHEQFPAPELIEFGVAAEAAGFDAVWASDHFHPWQDNQGHAGQAWITLAALGQRTARIVMGTGVTCPTYRYRPAIVAQSFASLEMLYPGRIFLGVGSGEALNEVPAGGGWGTYRERAERMVEAAVLMRQLWSGDWVTHPGPYYQVENARLYDAPQRPIPIYIAAGGPKSARIAGAHGDGLVTVPKGEVKPEILESFQAGAREAGKDPASMPVLAEQYVIVGGRAEAEEGARLWRFSPKASDFTANPDPREIQRGAEESVPLEEVYRNWAVSEDPREHVEALRRLVESGVTQVFIHSPQPDQRRVIEFFGREVLPALRGTGG